VSFCAFKNTNKSNLAEWDSQFNSDGRLTKAAVFAILYQYSQIKNSGATIKSTKIKEVNMANLHSGFEAFHETLVLSQTKKEALRQSRDAIRSRIEAYFKEMLKVEIPKFHAQGSFAMLTIVNPLDGEFDLDDGIYLQHLNEHDQSEWPTPEAVHSWIVEATEGYTTEKPIDKRTCVRVRYAGQYHIDLPSYAKFEGNAMLAETGEKGWHRSDPIALTERFIEQVKKRGEQLRRFVRYFKAWADYQSGTRGTMPCSLILTVLATDYFQGDERDDVSMAQTANAIRDAIQVQFRVRNPVDNMEELAGRLSDGDKQRFQEAIDDLAKDAAKANCSKSKKEASKLWQNQFGERFPLVDNDDEKENQKKQNAERLAAFYTPRNPAKPWGSR
jgi:hypothetical protein